MSRLSARQHETLVAVASAALPAGKILPAAGEATVDKVERFLDHLPSALAHGLGGLLAGLDAAERLPIIRARIG